MKSPASSIARSTQSAPGSAMASRSSGTRLAIKDRIMNCLEFNEWLDDLLVREAGEPLPADVARHRAECAECARQHALALETVAALTPPVSLGASPELKKRILGSIPPSA